MDTPEPTIPAETAETVATETPPASAPAPTKKPAPKRKRSTVSKRPTKSPLDHDGDGRKGGIAPIPEVQHLVVTQDDPDRALEHGEVIAVSDTDARYLLRADAARVATGSEVELAQPRVRTWAR